MRNSPVPLLRLVFAILALSAAQLATAATAPTHGPRAVLDFNPGWRLYRGDAKGAEARDFDDRRWQPVTLPHAWNEDDAFKKDISEHSTGIAWYRKRFTLPADYVGGKVFLEFEGVRQAAEVWVNGKYVGLHENGAMAFGLDLSEAVVPGENVVAVRTDNAWDYKERATGQIHQWQSTAFNANYGGINKNVRLHLAGRIYQTLPLYSNLGTTGVYVYATDFDVEKRAATICVEAELRNETESSVVCALETAIAGPDGKRLAAFRGEPVAVAAGATSVLRAAQRVADLQFWSWGYGYLYDVATSVKVGDRSVDTVVTRTGFRKTDFGDGMFALNGRVLHLKGYAQRTTNEWPAIGLSVPAWLSDFSNRLMVDGNANLVRWMHLAPWKQDVESCDRVGLLQSMPAGDAEEDVQGRQWSQRVELMRDAIVYNRNNPSIVFYESGNRGISESHMSEMKAVRDRYDPHGGRAIGCRDMLASQVAEYGGEMQYVDKSTRQPFWAMEYCRDEGARAFWDEFSPPFHKDGEGPLHRGADARKYNRNQDSFAIEDVVRWEEYWRARPGTGRRVNAGGVNIVFSDSNTHHRGANNYRRSGEVDAMRIPKDAYWAHQVMWDGWVDVERPRLHLIGHWSYAPGTVKPVYVVSSADRVELFLNGRSLGFGEQSHRFLFAFPAVAWQPGTLQAVGYSADGKRLCEATLETAGEPKALRLKSWTRPGGLRADGADLALVEVEVVDGHGRRCPTATDKVVFDVSGPAEWRGGIAQGPGNFILGKMLPVECGVNRVLVRSTTEAGIVRLNARAEGLQPASLEFRTTEHPVGGGLAAFDIRDRLPPNLSRGPTPIGPSFRPKRLAVAPARVLAGSIPEKVGASYDDNELSSWESAPALGQAWIEYAFDREVVLSEIDLKVVNMRYREYPLRVTVDGTEVYEGTTPMGQGYATLPLEAKRGRKVRIALTDAPLQNDAAKIVELADKPVYAPSVLKRVRPALGIVEAEFYEAAP